MKFEYCTYTLVSESVISNEGFLQLRGDCEDLDFFMLLPLEEGIYDKLITIFKEKVNNYLKQKTDEDPEVFIVERFIQSLDKIYKDMENLKTNPNKNLILDFKLKYIFQLDLYKQWIPFTDLQALKDYYFNRYHNK